MSKAQALSALGGENRKKTKQNNENTVSYCGTFKVCESSHLANQQTHEQRVALSKSLPATGSLSLRKHRVALGGNGVLSSRGLEPKTDKSIWTGRCITGSCNESPTIFCTKADENISRTFLVVMLCSEPEGWPL